MPPPPTFTVRLKATKVLAPQVRELAFERVGETPLEFQAGQWINLVLPLDPVIKRAYSIASPPRGDGTFELAITHVQGGPGSTYLHGLEPGATLEAMGPSGFFTGPKAAAHPCLFVATGTGITPLRSILLDELARGNTAPMRLLCGVRKSADRLYQDELSALAQAHPNFSFAYTLSQPEAGWTGLTGYVQTHLAQDWHTLAAAAPQGAPPHAYICGLQRMVGAVRDLLRKDLGAERQQVHSERYD
jgi:CDP-4-dehydro-6-deoxyglucose reductase